MYVDEVKGIEFDKVFVVSAKMRRNEKYIAYTRALSELIIIVDESIAEYDTESNKNQEANTNKKEHKTESKKRKPAALKWDGKKKLQKDEIVEKSSVQEFSEEREIFLNQIEVENSSQFKEPVKELLENIENYYKKYGKLDLPIRVAVDGQKYLLKDNYAQ